MKNVSSYCVICCFVLIMIVTSINTAWGACELEYKLGLLDCPVYKKVYPIYKKLESILTNDTETLYLMRQTFFRAIAAPFMENEKINVVRIRVCWIPNKMRPLPACNSNNQTAAETRCWDFRWSRSPALNMIAVEQLLGFDPVFTAQIYSRFVDHTRSKNILLVFDISPDLFPCTPSEDDLTQATVLLLTWSKAYAKAQGVPTSWSQEDQGYIARWYSYYCAEAYFRSKEIGKNTRKVLLIIFILLNLFILHTTVIYGTKWYCRFYEILNDRSQKASGIYLAVGITTTILNFAYLTATVVLCVNKHSIPPIYVAECTAISDWVGGCSPSHDSSLYKDELASFITKMLVIIIAMIVHFLIAFKVPIKTALLTTKWRHSSKCYRVFQIILHWNIFLFVQMLLGLISLPACLLLLIAPLQTISLLCEVCLMIASLTVLIVCLLQFGRRCHIRTCCFEETCGHLLWYLILAALTVAITFLYLFLLPQGESLSNARGVVFSLLPPIALSITSWTIKRKFLSKDSTKRKLEKQLSISSMSTEEEDLQDSDTEQDTRLDDLV